jgi:hypothetical protein
VASPRLDRIRQLLGALGAILARRPEPALAVAHALAAQVMDPGFDLEAAALTVSLWVRLPEGERPQKEFDALLRAVGLRFCVSKASTEVLASSANKLAAAEDTLRNCHSVISNIAEQALTRSMSGAAAIAVDTLLDQGEHTRNAKLIDMAAAVARRQAQQLSDVDAVQARVKAMQDAYCAPLTHIAGVRRSARMPGGLVLRT